MAKKFTVPTQVRFWDYDNRKYMGGIAYGNEVICGCCGGTFLIDEIYEFAPEGVDPLTAYDYWVDISEEIKGDDL